MRIQPSMNGIRRNIFWLRCAKTTRKKNLKKVKESLKKCGKKNKRTRQDGGGKGKIWYKHGKEDFIA